MADCKQLDAKEVKLKFLQLHSRSIRYLEVNSESILKETDFQSTEDVSHCLFLGTDVMRNCGISQKNLPRFHSQLAPQGCATKATFPTDWKIGGMKLHSTAKSAWCYNIRGLLRVALEHYELVDQIKLVRDMQQEFSKFVQSFEGRQFPVEININFLDTVNENETLQGPPCVDSLQTYDKHRENLLINEGLEHQRSVDAARQNTIKPAIANMRDHDYLTTNHGLEPMEVLHPPYTNADASTQTFLEEFLDISSPNETGSDSIANEHNRRKESREPEPPEEDTPNRSDLQRDHLSPNDNLASLASLDAAKLTLTEMTNLTDVFPKSIGQLGIDCLELVRQEALIFKHTGHNIFPLNLIQDYLESKKAPELFEIAHDYELVLHILAGWIGQQFASLNSFIRRKVDNFKQDHILDLQNMPLASKIMDDVFPSGMTLLLREWLKHIEQMARDDQADPLTNTDTIALVCLELLNNTLITGKGHVLFSRLQSQGTRSALE